MASPTQWIWVWASSRRWWRIGKPDVVWFIGSQRVGHNWVTEQQKEYVTITWWECDCRERKVLNYLFSIWTNCRGKCCGRYWCKQIERSTKGSTGSSSLCVMRASRLFRDQLFVISEKIFLFTISKVASSLSLFKPFVFCFLYLFCLCLVRKSSFSYIILIQYITLVDCFNVK